MRFITAKTQCKLSSHGEEYILTPVHYPKVDIHNILAGEYGYVLRTLNEAPHIQEAFFDPKKIPGFPKKATNPSSIPPGSRVLIMRVGGLGDMIMLTPVLRYIKERLNPDVDVTLATFKYSHELFYKNPCVDAVIPSPVRLSHLLKYDYYMEFFDEKNDNEEKIFASMNMVDYHFKGIEVDYNNLDDDSKRVHLPNNIACSEDIIKFYSQLDRKQYRAIALASLFSSSPTRDFPPGHFEVLIRSFPDVLFVVPYKDKTVFKGRFDRITNSNLIYLNTSGSITEYITAIEQSDIVVCSDSSAYHIAEALGKKSIVLFGSVNPDFRIRYYQNVRALSVSYKGLYCKSPCGISDTKWIKTSGRIGRELIRQKLYDPDRGCPEAVRLGKEYSPCLLTIPSQDIVDLFRETLDQTSLSRDGSIKSEPRPTISACLMVKNEEKFLPQCLQSIRDYVDEIIVVDTGSTDNTMNIAGEFGAKVYEHPWENDFSKHRNQSISYATGDWILIIDADEKIDHKTAPMLWNAVKESPSAMIAILVRNFTHNSAYSTESLSVRLFKNRLGIHYDGIIHNQIQIIEPPATFPVILWHYGYDLDEEEMHKKRSRSLKLLLKQAKTRPHCHITQHHLAVTYFSEYKWEKALKSGLKSLKLLEDCKDHGKGLGWTYFIISFSLFKLGRIDEAVEKALEGLEKFPRSIDLHHLMACLLVGKKDFKGVLRYAETYFNLRKEYKKDPSPFGLDLFEMFHKEDNIYHAMGYAYYDLGHREKALESFRLARDTMKSDRGENLKQIAKFLAVNKEHEEALSFLESIRSGDIPFEPDFLKFPGLFEKADDQGLAVRAYDTLERLFPRIWDIPYHRGLYYLRKQEFEAASGSFEKANDLSRTTPEILVNWGYALTKLGQYVEAKGKYLSALEINPEEPNAVINLGILYYQMNRYEDAVPFLKRATEIDPDHIYAMLALCHIYLKINEIEKIVPLCERLLRELELPKDFNIESVSDLGHIFFLISKTLLSRKNHASHEIAFQIGHVLTGGYPKPMFEMVEQAIKMGDESASRRMLAYIREACPALETSDNQQ